MFLKNLLVASGAIYLASCSTPPPEMPSGADQPAQIGAPKKKPTNYQWTNDHMQVGVRWQPFGIDPADEFDSARPVIAKDSSYAQFWLSWAQAEPESQNKDYTNHMSAYLRAIDKAVDCSRLISPGRVGRYDLKRSVWQACLLGT